MNSKVLIASMFALGLTLSAHGFAASSELPKKPETQSQASQSVQEEVNKKAEEATTEKRKELIADATTALLETEKALKALNENKQKEALEALAVATGKLELVLARNPKLALAPVSTDVIVFDLLAKQDTAKALIKEANKHLNDGEIQEARQLIANLASEIQFRTTNIPLETYPAAIKAITPLVDTGKAEEAKAKLQALLHTLVVKTDVVPLPKLRAEEMLKEAQTLSEKKDRSKDENDKLARYLQDTREQLEFAELLGYGKKSDYKPMYDQLKEISSKSADGKSGTGWFDKIKKQLSDLI